MQKILNEAKARNPFPEDIFIAPTSDEYKLLKKAIEDAGLVQDKFFGSFGRRVWNNCIATIEQIIEEEPNINDIEIALKTISESKKYIATEPDLANYMLRDLQITKKAELDDLSWAMHRHGCTKNDVLGLITNLEKYIQDAQVSIEKV